MSFEQHPPFLEKNQIYCGDSRDLLGKIDSASIALSVWSPPYFVGKDYEAYLNYEQWQELISSVIGKHTRILKPGGFLAINISDILCFKDETLPRIQAELLGSKRLPLSREEILSELSKNPQKSRYELAKHFGVSEQTIDRRLNGNNARGGKYEAQTRVKLVGGLIERWAYESGLYLYDRRVWVKDPAWANSRWAKSSYRAVDEFEYVYVFWKPGVTQVNRDRLSQAEWTEWGSRGVWFIPSVRANDDHEAKFPVELPRRLIALLTEPGDCVLDCFLGSGTTAVAARKLGRKYIGIEKEQKYVVLARNRVLQV